MFRWAEVFMANFAPLLTKRLIIRLIEEKDAEEFFRYRTLPEVYKYQAWKPADLAGLKDYAIRNSILEPFGRGQWTQFAICDAENGVLMGDMGICLDEDGFQAEIGFTISPAFQNGGYAYEATQAMLDHLFKALGLHRVYASVDPNNQPSIGLLVKLGFRSEAHFIKSYLMRGAWYDDCIYGMLQEEWVDR
jgi:RimJ/RimL family protein N-acetyltransferase